MFRYRCPQCNQLLQAPEIRAGKTTVCSKCSQPLTIPADKTSWLNEKGEPLLTSPTMVIRSEAHAPPPAAAAPRGDDFDLPQEADNDVLGAIFLGAISPSSIGPPSAAYHTENLAPPRPVVEIPQPVPPPPKTAAVPRVELPPAPVPDPEPDPEPAAEVKPAFSRRLDADDGSVDFNPPPKLEPAPESASLSETRVPPAAAEEPPVEAPPPAPVAAEEPPAPLPPPRTPTPLPRPLPRRTPAAAAPAPRTPFPTPPPQPPVPTPPPRRSTAADRPFGPAVPVGAADEPAWAGSRAGPRSRRMVAAAPVHPAEAGGGAAVAEPLRLRSGMDLAVDLTSALATRMKPPPKPPRDLKPSTAVWILLTGIAVALLVVSLVTATDFGTSVLVIGVTEVVLGFGWVAWLAFTRNPLRGLIALFPPVGLWFLTQWKYAKYRPLRFVLTGAALALLALLVPKAQPHTRAWAGVPDGSAPVAARPDITTRPKVAQLQYYHEQRQYDALIALLKSLARTDPTYSEDAKNRIELAAELKALCGHADTGVKVEALAAYATWGGGDARDLCLEATGSPNREERMKALELLPKWKDETVARRIAERIGRPGTETTRAQDGLIALGGPVAERAAIRLLKNEDQTVRLAAIEILGNEKVGGADAAAALEDAARTSPDPGTRLPAAGKAELIRARLKKS